MHYLVVPFGKHFGWGICGKHLTRELSQLSSIRLVTERFDATLTESPLEFEHLKQFLATPREIEGLRSDNPPSAALQAIVDHSLRPFYGEVNASRKVGYTFFESQLAAASIAFARQYYSVVATGSTWCTNQLRNAGLSNAETVLQGVDPLAFHAGYSEKQFFRDRFVVFSGGKFELRKGQDLIIRAYKVMQDRYPDVMLVTSWSNLWKFSLATMEASPYLKFKITTDNFAASIQQCLHDQGVDLGRVVMLPMLEQCDLARIYQNTDIGVFPNRCEGGTNLVMMEYMACGKPVIASNSTGHRDIVSSQNALLIEPKQTMNVMQNGQPHATWDDFDLDELIALLESAYANRRQLDSLAQRGANDMAALTWRRTARQFQTLLNAHHEEAG